MGKIALFLLLLTASVSMAAETLTVTDMLGRKITVPAKAERVIPLGSSMSYVSFLKAQDTVIGIEKIDRMTFEKRPYVYANREITAVLPVVAEGGAARRPNIELIVSLKPDVIFTITADASEAELLQRKTRTPVVVLSYGYSGVNFDDIYKSLRIAGKILGRDKRAEELITYMESLQEELSSPPAVKKRAYIGAVSYKGTQGINSTEAHFLPFRLAGVENAADKIGRKGHLFIDKEFAAMMKTDLIFVDSAGFAVTAQHAAKEPAYFSRMKPFTDGSAYMILANTFYFINIDLMLANSFFIAKAAYPEKYADLDPEKKADDIIEMFTGRRLFSVVREDSGGFKRITLSGKGFSVEKPGL